MIESQIAELGERVDAFERVVISLDEDAFLGTVGGWTPRDIVAHLIGWNRHVIEGSCQILRGELPFYDVDPGENFSNVNRELIRRYPSRDRGELLSELRTSQRELETFLRTLDENAWQGDHGVRNAGATVTVRDTMDELIEDYVHHRKQIEPLAT